jgi:type IV secretory pathway protease TraF
VYTKGDFVVVEYTVEDNFSSPETITNRYKRLSEIRGFPVGFVDVNGVIPNGYYYFGSDVSHGWDSRYLGLINDELVLGRAKLLKSFKIGK